jgi:hypothetical protein
MRAFAVIAALRQAQAACLRGFAPKNPLILKGPGEGYANFHRQKSFFHRNAANGSFRRRSKIATASNLKSA